MKQLFMKYSVHCQITVENMRGQGYDGEAICLLELLECRHVSKRNHLLQHMCIVVDTVISHSCVLPEVRNMLDKLKVCALFFENISQKRGNLLQFIVDETEGSSY